VQENGYRTGGEAMIRVQGAIFFSDAQQQSLGGLRGGFPDSKSGGEGGGRSGRILLFEKGRFDAEGVGEGVNWEGWRRMPKDSGGGRRRTERPRIVESTFDKIFEGEFRKESQPLVKRNEGGE